MAKPLSKHNQSLKRQLRQVDDSLSKIEKFKEQFEHISFDALILEYTQERVNLANQIGRKKNK